MPLDAQSPLVQSTLDLQAWMAEEVLSNVPPLASICERAVVEGVSPSNVCSALSLVDLLSPVLDGESLSIASATPCHFSSATWFWKVQIIDKNSPHGLVALELCFHVAAWTCEGCLLESYPC